MMENMYSTNTPIHYHDIGVSNFLTTNLLLPLLKHASHSSLPYIPVNPIPENLLDPSVDRLNPYSNAWMYSEEAFKSTIDFIGSKRYAFNIERDIREDEKKYRKTEVELLRMA
jgi:hypothetical protein